VVLRLRRAGQPLPLLDAAVLAALGGPQNQGGAQSEKKFESLPYIGFRGVKTTKHVDELRAAGIEPNDFYLCESGEYLPLKPAELHVLQFARLFTQQDDDGKLIGASFTNSDALYEDGFREHLFVVAAVIQRTDKGPKYTAATLSLRSGQTQALKQTISLLEGPAADPDKWSTRSPNHKVTAAAKVPGGRFKVRIWNTQEKPASGKGQPYNLGHGSVSLPTAAEVEAFNAWVAADFPRISKVIGLHNRRVEEARKAANGIKE
jgi:hypothetical protein